MEVTTLGAFRVQAISSREETLLNASILHMRQAHLREHLSPDEIAGTLNTALDGTINTNLIQMPMPAHIQED